MPIENRICECCNLNCIEDEYHVIFKCPLYNEIRHKNLTNVDHSIHNMYNFNKIMSENKDSEKVYALAKFIYNAMAKRKEVMLVNV